MSSPELRFQRDHDIELPLAYARFLAGVGRNMGEFLLGSDLWFEQLPSQLDTALAILEDDSGPELPQNAFVFCSHQGYQFLFFHLGEGPDPPVHHYLEGTKELKVVAPSFSSWLADAVRDEFAGDQIEDLLPQIARMAGCTVAPPRGMPVLRPQDQLPADLIHFYTQCGGVRLHDGASFPTTIVGPDQVVRSNPEIVGRECADDITDSWYIVARGGEEKVSIDLHPERLGRCYDSLWDRHGVPRSCPIVALTFTELLRRFVEVRGQRVFWAEGEPNYGDAYDETR